MTNVIRDRVHVVEMSGAVREDWRLNVSSLKAIALLQSDGWSTIHDYANFIRSIVVDGYSILIPAEAHRRVSSEGYAELVLCGMTRLCLLLLRSQSLFNDLLLGKFRFLQVSCLVFLQETCHFGGMGDARIGGRGCTLRVWIHRRVRDCPRSHRCCPGLAAEGEITRSNQEC